MDNLDFIALKIALQNTNPQLGENIYSFTTDKRLLLHFQY